LGGPRLNTMAKGETIMPTPQGDITSTETWSEAPVEETPVAEEATEVVEEENDQA
jgi:hypothetical protein